MHRSHNGGCLGGFFFKMSVLENHLGKRVIFSHGKRVQTGSWRNNKIKKTHDSFSYVDDGQMVLEGSTLITRVLYEPQELHL